MVATFDKEAFLTKLKEEMADFNRRDHIDLSIEPYCDVHLGTRMYRSESWTSVEYRSLEDAEVADANRWTDMWFCLKDGCDRCYRPMFGYHVNQPGMRYRNSGSQRCNHPDVPCMYIGKVGTSRQYMCPKYKCRRTGPVVRTDVVDEQVPLPIDPFEGLKKDDRKKAYELGIFLKFAPVCGSPIDSGSVVNGQQFYPDIYCTISDAPYHFELGRIVNKTVAEKLNPDRRKKEGGFTFDQSEPFRNIIDDKGTKTYRTNGVPVDLILHCDLLFGSSDVAEGMCRKYEDRLKALVASGPFKRVWVFDEVNERVLCQH